MASSRPPIQNAVKSHLSGAELVGARAVAHDRVLEIIFRRAVGGGAFQSKSLIFEASGRYSNLILLDNDGERKTIIEAASHIYPDVNRYRTIIPGRPYTPPPPIDGVLLENFPIGGEDGDIDKIIGLGKPLIAAIKKTCAQNERSVSGVIAPLIEHAAGVSVCQRIGSYVTVFPELLSEAARLDTVSPLEAARHCAILPIMTRHADRIKRKIGSRLASLTKTNAKKIDETEALLRSSGDAERLMETGRLLLANLSSIPRGAAQVKLTEWTEGGAVTRVAELDPEKDASRNAEAYFTKYKKKRAAAERAERVLPSLYGERGGLMEQEAALMSCDGDILILTSIMEELLPPPAPKGKKDPPPPPHKRVTIAEGEGTLFIGSSAKGNHYVTFRLAVSGDIWLHAQGVPGAHVILRVTGKPDGASLARMREIAASAAAYYSRARGSGNIRVDYTERRHVRAITGAGPAQVTYHEFSSIYANSDEFVY
jgi:predicted ribosome quality control (RQC) complex YloA/Tae2 family protein